MKVIEGIVLCALCIVTVNISLVAAEENNKEMPSIEYFDHQIQRLKDKEYDLLRDEAYMEDIVDKANSGEYYIQPSMMPIKKSDFEDAVIGRIIEHVIEKNSPSPIMTNPERIAWVIRFTQFIRQNGDKILDDYKNELVRNGKLQVYYMNERARVMALTGGTSNAGTQSTGSSGVSAPQTTGAQSGASTGVSIPPTPVVPKGDILFFHLVGQPEVSWGTEDQQFRDCFTVNLDGRSVIYQPDPKNVPVHGEFTMTWDEPPKYIGRNGLDWWFKAEITSMPKGNDGCGIKAKFSDFFHADNENHVNEKWVGIGQDGKTNDGEKIVITLKPEFDALRGETDVWINIEIYYLYITYHFKVTMNAAPPEGIR